MLEPATALSSVGVKRGKWFFVAYSAGALPAPEAAGEPQDTISAAIDDDTGPADALDIGIEPDTCADMPSLLPSGLLADSYTAALPPRSLSGVGIAAFSGSKEAMQEEGSTVDMLIPELPVSLHFLTASSVATTSPHVTLAELGITLGALHEATRALNSSSLLAIGVLPPLSPSSVPVDDRHLEAWSVIGACTVGSLAEGTPAEALRAGSDSQAALCSTLLRGCSKSVRFDPPPAGSSGGQLDLGTHLGMPLHSLGVTQYHPWLLRVVLAPSPSSTAKLAVAAIDIGLRVSERQLDTCSVGDLARAVCIAALSRTQHLRLELREPRAATHMAHLLLQRSSQSVAGGAKTGGASEGGEGGVLSGGCALPLGALTAFHGSSKQNQQMLLGGNVPLGGDSAAVMGSGIWGMAGLGSWGAAWGPSASLAGLPLPSVSDQAQLKDTLQCADVAQAGAVLHPSVPLGNALLALLEGQQVGVYAWNEGQSRGGSAVTTGPGAALQVLSDQLTAVSMMLLPRLQSGDGAVWAQLPFQLAAVLPLAAQTYVTRKQQSQGGSALFQTPSGALAELLAQLPSSFVYPPLAPPVQPHTGAAPTDMNQLQQSLLQRQSMLLVLQGRNFRLVDHLDTSRPGLTIEIPDSTTVAQLLAMLGGAADSDDAAVRSFADASRGASADELWLERAFWASHVPGDVLDEEEGRRRKPGYFGLPRTNCGGGGGLMERAGHFGMRLLDLGLPRMHGVVAVADLRGGHPDASKGQASALAAAAAAGGSS